MPKRQEGTLQKRSGGWYLLFRDFFIEDGKPIRKQVCVRLADVNATYRRESDLANLVAEKLAGVRSAAKSPDSAEKFVTFVETVYFPYAKQVLKPSTYGAYKSYFAVYIKPYTGEYLLRDFTKKIVCDLLDTLAGLKPPDVRRPLNVETIKKVKQILSAIFTFAECKGALPSERTNPAHGALLPVAPPAGETFAASPVAVQNILDDLKEKKMLLARAAVALSAFAGLRPSECRGLKWENYDRKQQHLNIECAVVRASEGTTKTDKPRLQRVNATLRAVLADLWESQKNPISGYVLSRPKGNGYRAEGGRVNLDNMSKRELATIFGRCAVCGAKQAEAHDGHTYQRVTWYTLRRFHGTQIRAVASNVVAATSLGNSEAVAEKHYIKQVAVLPEHRKAVDKAFAGFSV